MRTLLVAAGGGGDAITAAALATSPRRNDGPAVVMTFSWDRLIIDPRPGPRVAADFTGLSELAPGLSEILLTTRPVPPAGSTLPRLAAELPARLLLLDPACGAVGLAEQITAAAQHFGADQIDVLDVGGDALTDGTDPGLRSPLADQLAVAACARTGLPARLLITGAGLDGEIPISTIARRLALLDAESLPPLSRDEADSVRAVFAWHPSEASGLLIAAASGQRGRVEVRDAGDQVDLTDNVAAISAVNVARAAAATPAGQLIDSVSLARAEQIINDLTGKSEIQYETRKAAQRQATHAHLPTVDDLPAVDRIATEAHARGSDYISTRRLAELLGATTPETYHALTLLLTSHRWVGYHLSTYATSVPA